MTTTTRERTNSLTYTHIPTAVLSRNMRRLAKFYRKQLTGAEVRDLGRLKKYYRDVKYKTKGTHFVLADKEVESIPLIKTLLFEEYERIPGYSPLYKQAFEILEGEEVDYYHQSLLNRWQAAACSYFPRPGGAGVKNVPPGIMALVKNIDFKIEHIYLFLTHSQVTREHKANLLKVVSNNVYSRGLHFTEKEIEFIIMAYKKFKFDITSVLPSVRLCFDADGLPDEWVIAAYCS